MRFMMFMYPDLPAAASDEEWTPTAEDVAPMSRFNQELEQAGVLLALDGLTPAKDGASVTFRGGTPTVTDGPFAEAKEVVGGYWILEVGSQEEAVEWASRVPANEGDRIEVRRIFDLTDFPQDVQDAVIPLDLDR